MIEPINKVEAFKKIQQDLERLKNVFNREDYLEFSEHYVFSIFHGSYEYTLEEYEKMKDLRILILNK